MKRWFFGWENIKYILKQIYLTFGGNKSDLSSKRIERAAFVSTSIGVVIATTIYLINSGKMDALEATILYSPLLVAAGYNVSMGIKDKKVDNEISNSETPAKPNE